MAMRDAWPNERPMSVRISATDWAGSDGVTPDEADSIEPGDRVLLVALSDLDQRSDVTALARKQGFKVLATSQAETALMTARRERPHAIVLGMDLRVRDGWSLLHALKHNHETRHLPTVVVHSPDATDGVHHGRLAGAIDIIDSPVSHERIAVVIEELSSYLDRATRSLLVVTSDAVDETSVVVALFGDMPDVEMKVVTTVDEAYAALDASAYDCVVVDLKLADALGNAAIAGGTPTAQAVVRWQMGDTLYFVAAEATPACWTSTEPITARWWSASPAP